MYRCGLFSVAVFVRHIWVARAGGQKKRCCRPNFTFPRKRVKFYQHVVTSGGIVTKIGTYANMNPTQVFVEM